MPTQDEIIKLSKGEAMQQVKKFFKGNKKFIEQVEILIASTDRFVGVEEDSFQMDKNNFRWDKFFKVRICFEYWNEGCKKFMIGYKVFYYRKGNEKYKSHNQTAEIHDYQVSIISDGEISSYDWNA